MKNLTIKDRIVITGVLPKQGAYEDIIRIESILKKVEITSEELDKFKIKSSVGEDGKSSVTWTEEGNTAEFPIDFTEEEERLIKKRLKEMDENKEILIEQSGLCKLFL